MKQNKTIYYLAHYDENVENSNAVLSAVNKVNYIIDTLVDIGYNIEIISARTKYSDTKVSGFCKEIRKGIRLRTFDCERGGNIFRRFIRRIKLNKEVKKHLLNNVKVDDTLIIYHSLGYARLYDKIKKQTGAKVIIEAEEIYSDVSKCRGFTRKKELRCLTFADGYIFPTELLNATVNQNNKRYVIIYGTYKVETECGQPFNDGRIHIVYAGTFDPRKGGAAAAAAAAEFLDNRYHVHILGFGSDSDKNFLLKTIGETQKKTKCLITFEGLKSGKEYIEFIQSCDVGLSTQNPKAAFNDTSFPSKILSYMANGLRVVSIRIPAIENSKIGKYMYYYKQQAPDKIAEAIKNVDFNDNYNGRDIIKELDEKFKVETSSFLESL